MPHEQEYRLAIAFMHKDAPAATNAIIALGTLIGVAPVTGSRVSIGLMMTDAVNYQSPETGKIYFGHTLNYAVICPLDGSFHLKLSPDLAQLLAVHKVSNAPFSYSRATRAIRILDTRTTQRATRVQRRQLAELLATQAATRRAAILTTSRTTRSRHNSGSTISTADRRRETIPMGIMVGLLLVASFGLFQLWLPAAMIFFLGIAILGKGWWTKLRLLGYGMHGVGIVIVLTGLGIGLAPMLLGAIITAPFKGWTVLKMLTLWSWWMLAGISGFNPALLFLTIIATAINFLSYWFRK